MTVYVPKFTEVFESLVMDNILGIVKYKFKPALDVLFPAEDYPDIAQRTLGNFIRLALPAIAVEPDRGADNESEDSSHLGPQLKIAIYLAVEHADPVEATRLGVNYTRTLRSVLKTASNADYVVGVPTNEVTALQRDLTWQYGQLSKDADRGMWVKPVSFELNLKYLEQ